MVRALALIVLLAGTAAADKKKAAPKAPPPPPQAEVETGDAPISMTAGATHPEGQYGGVVPGQHVDPKEKARRPPKGTLSWIGFEAKSGGSEIFLQSIAPFEVAQHIEKGVLIVNLTGLNQLGQNTWRFVDTRFFATPLARVVARRVGAVRGKNGHPAGIEVRMTFKNPKDAKEGALRTGNEADGYYYAHLEFGGGTAATPAGEPSINEPEK